jgi:hypothetical protein
VIRESTSYDDYLLGLENDAANGTVDMMDDSEDQPDDNTGMMAQIRKKLGL